MQAYTYIGRGKFELLEKPKPGLKDSRDAIVRVTLSSICTSDLHIKHGSVPRAVPGITVGHGWVGVVEQIRIGCRHGQGRRPGCGQCRNLLRRVFLFVNTGM